MRHCLFFPLRYISFFSALFISTFLYLNESARAGSGILPDNTLGAERSIITPVTPQLDQISGGALRGGSLFHSFTNFNIEAGKIAEFSNQPNIQNIFSRVTGSDPSNLFGTLKTNGSSNLYFVNPNGIVFGQNSRLDVGGSFVATTADKINFPNGQDFSASNPKTPPVLTVNVQSPIGIEFSKSPGSISVKDTRLEVGFGNSITLLGGKTDISNSSISAPAGRVDIGAISSTSTTALILTNNQADIASIPNHLRADISVQDNSSINTNSSQGGAINIVGRSLSVNNRSAIASTTFNSGETSGNIYIDLSGDLKLTNFGLIHTHVLDQGKAGDIFIKANNIALDRSIISSLTDGGRNGQITITASSSVSLNDSITQTVGYTGNLQEGLTITSPILILNNGSRITTDIQDNIVSREKPGSITLNIENLLLLRNNSLISSNGIASQDGGLILINSPKGFIIAGPNENNDILATASGGRGGTISVTPTTKIFGIQKSDLPFLKAILNRTNDIAAGSLVENANGSVDGSSTPILDPSRGLAKISEDVPRVSLIEGCEVIAGNEAVRFYTIGLGGKPPEPGESTNTDTYLIGWASLNFDVSNNTSKRVDQNRESLTSTLDNKKIVYIPICAIRSKL